MRLESSNYGIRDFVREKYKDREENCSNDTYGVHDVANAVYLFAVILRVFPQSDGLIKCAH